MRVPILLGLGLFLPLSACRDSEEIAMNQLEQQGYGFTVDDYHRAAGEGDMEAIRGYLDAGMAVDVELKGMTAFQIAAEADQDEVVRGLIELGADADQRLTGGQTMLMRVAGRTDSDLRLLEFLLENRADPRASDVNNLTPLMIASLAGNVDAVRRLSLRDVRSLDRGLMLASAQGHTHCLEALVERGAYVNCRSHDSQTPLMYAASKGHMEATQLLLRHHANRFALDEDGRTAADRADDLSKPALATVLRDTSTLLGSKVPANNEFLPSLDGQLVALLSEPVVSETMDLVDTFDPIEPDRPALDFPEAPQLPTEADDRSSPTGGSPPIGGSPSVGGSSPVSSTPVVIKPVITEPETIGTSASVSPRSVDLQKELRLGRFEERFEPIMVTDVTGDRAKVRLLARPPEEAIITVLVGQTIPDTSYEITRMKKRIRPAKGGGTVDVSEVFAKTSQTEDAEETRFVRNALPRDKETHLVVETANSNQRYAARPGDVFTVAETREVYMVTDVRPHQLLIRNEDTQEILTIERI